MLGEAPRRARPAFAAPTTPADKIRRGVAAEHMLGVPPEQQVHDIGWFGMVNVDHLLPSSAGRLGGPAPICSRDLPDTK